MPRLPRRGSAFAAVPASAPTPEPAAGAVPAAIPWALGPLLGDGAAPLAPRPASGDAPEVVLVLGPGDPSPRAAGLPAELYAALRAEGVEMRVLTAEQA